MTETRTPIPLADIEALRLTCRHCGVSIIMPLDSTREVPHKCFNCCHEFPAQPLQDFMQKAYRLAAWIEDRAGR